MGWRTGSRLAVGRDAVGSRCWPTAAPARRSLPATSSKGARRAPARSGSSSMCMPAAPQQPVSGKFDQAPGPGTRASNATQWRVAVRSRCVACRAGAGRRGGRRRSGSAGESAARFEEGDRIADLGRSMPGWTTSDSWQPWPGTARRERPAKAARLAAASVPAPAPIAGVQRAAAPQQVCASGIAASMPAAASRRSRARSPAIRSAPRCSRRRRRSPRPGWLTGLEGGVRQRGAAAAAAKPAALDTAPGRPSSRPSSRGGRAGASRSGPACAAGRRARTGGPGSRSASSPYGDAGRAGALAAAAAQAVVQMRVADAGRGESPARQGLHVGYAASRGLGFESVQAVGGAVRQAQPALHALVGQRQQATRSKRASGAVGFKPWHRC